MGHLTAARLREGLDLGEDGSRHGLEVLLLLLRGKGGTVDQQ